MLDRSVGLTGDVDYQDVVGETGEFTSPPLRFGNRFRHTFNEVGQFNFHSEPHPWMTGAVIVSVDLQ